MSCISGPSMITSGLLLSLDFDSVKDYVSGITAETSVSEYTLSFFNGATYNTVADGVMTFTRENTTVSKTTAGGGINTTVAGDLAATTFLYNDFTWEIWFRINDINPSNYDANETSSVIAVYQGFHAGFLYTSTQMRVTIWTGAATAASVATWTVGTSGAQINQGSWYQIVLTRSGNVFTPYINGAQLGAGTTTSTPVAGVATSNILSIGSSSASNFINYSRSTFSNMKMYNRALSPGEVSLNFNAIRGRFGL